MVAASSETTMVVYESMSARIAFARSLFPFVAAVERVFRRLPLGDAFEAAHQEVRILIVL